MMIYGLLETWGNAKSLKAVGSVGKLKRFFKRSSRLADCPVPVLR
jgi:hypothetical protein